MSFIGLIVMIVGIALAQLEVMKGLGMVMIVVGAILIGWWAPGIETSLTWGDGDDEEDERAEEV
jgi:high-affinity Fe2+/Pb2+ permease